MSNQTLRRLAKDFATGVTSKENYRKSRAELIQGIIAGKIAVKAIDYAPPLMPANEADEEITEGIKRNVANRPSPQQTAKPRSTPPPIKQNVASNKNNKNSPAPFIAVSAIIVVSLILAVILFYPKPPESVSVDKTTSSSANEGVTTNTETATATSMAAESLLADFLNEKNWNEDSLDNFIESWSALTDEEKEAAKQTKRMQRMDDSIYKQFLKGKALSSIDSEKAILKQQELIDFANAIGINDSSLTIE